MYGDAEATKLTLHKMRRDRDFERWQIEKSDDDVADRLASAGIGPAPTVAYWKRSPTGAHRNGVFVGKVFDTCMRPPSPCDLPVIFPYPPYACMHGPALSRAARSPLPSFHQSELTARPSPDAHRLTLGALPSALSLPLSRRHRSRLRGGELLALGHADRRRTGARAGH